jgi:hypothetical protein
MFKFNEKTYNHMPFAAYDKDVNAKQFCCLMINGLWKLHHFDGESWQRINTHLPKDATECSPTAEWEDCMWKISFVAGGFEGGRQFKLYRMLGLNGTPMEQCPADVGFVWKDRIAYAGRRGPLFVIDPEQHMEIKFHNVEFLYRVSYDASNPRMLLISGQLHGGEIFSWAYHPEMNRLFEVIADGRVAYKAASWNSDCYYAERRGGDDFEERHIRKAQHLQLKPFIVDEYVSLNIENTASDIAPEFE